MLGIEIDETALEATGLRRSRLWRWRRRRREVTSTTRTSTTAHHHTWIMGERTVESRWGAGVELLLLPMASTTTTATTSARSRRAAAAAVVVMAVVLLLPELRERPAEEVGGGADAVVGAAVDVARHGARYAVVAPPVRYVEPVHERDRVRRRPGRAERAAGADRPRVPRAHRRRGRRGGPAAAVRVHGLVVIVVVGGVGERRPVVVAHGRRREGKRRERQVGR